MKFIQKPPDPATLPNAQLLVVYSTTVLMLPHCKKSRKEMVESYGKQLTDEILRRMGESYGMAE